MSYSVRIHWKDLSDQIVWAEYRVLASAEGPRDGKMFLEVQVSTICYAEEVNQLVSNELRSDRATCFISKVVNVRMLALFDKDLGTQSIEKCICKFQHCTTYPARFHLSLS